MNHWATPGFDPVMLFLSGWIPWLIFVVIILLLIGFYSDKIFSRRNLFILIGLATAWILSDQISVHLFKDLFERLRPCHEPSLAGQVRLVVESCGGQYGFVSSHASNSFGLAIFSALAIKRKWFTICVFIWALAVSYSRIYIGVHYPGDIFGGLLLGLFIGLIVFNFLSLVTHHSSLFTRNS
ncbi:MAG: phosphatase PAP2 family protein [Bacteroidota bacterium]